MARLALPAARLAVAAAFAWLTVVWVTHRVVGGDTPWLVDGTDALAGCLSRHDFDACGFTGKLDAAGQMSAVGPYPLLQYVPDYLARWVGATHDTRYTFLALLSTVAVLAVLALAWFVLSRIGEGAWFWAFVLVVLTGPLIVYANTTWGELLAAGLLVCLVAAVVVTRPAAGRRRCRLRGVSDEGDVVPVRRSDCGTRARAGVAPHGRFDSRAPRLGRRGPGRCGGRCLPFQPRAFRDAREHELSAAGVPRSARSSAGVLCGPVRRSERRHPPLLGDPRASCWAGSCSPRSPDGGSERFDRWVAVVLTVIAAGITLSLAMWWAPFGWIAWGPRLSLPWVLPLLLLALVAFGTAARPFAARLLATPWRLLVVAAAVLALTLPHVGYLWRPQTTTEFFAHRSERCTSSRPFGSNAYYTCLREQMWTQRPIMNDALSGLGRVGGAFTALLVAAAVVGSLVLLREGIAPASAEARAGRREAARGARAALPR